MSLMCPGAALPQPSFQGIEEAGAFFSLRSNDFECYLILERWLPLPFSQTSLTLIGHEFQTMI